MNVSQAVADHFEEKLNTAIRLMKDYEIDYQEVGVFGSYARGDYKATSDIDICVITDNRPERSVSGEMREDAEELGIDIVFVSSQYFNENDTLFARNIRKDYRRVL